MQLFPYGFTTRRRLDDEKHSSIGGNESNASKSSLANGG
jgi:hypothetical protein